MLLVLLPLLLPLGQGPVLLGNRLRTRHQHEVRRRKWPEAIIDEEERRVECGGSGAKRKSEG